MNLKAVLIAGLVPAIPLPALAVCIDGKTASWYDEPGMLPKNPAPIGCASRDHKKGTQLLVTDLDTWRRVLCTVDDWGPMKWTGCDVDMPPGPAETLDMKERGTIRASIKVVGFRWALNDRWPGSPQAVKRKGEDALAQAPRAKPAPPRSAPKAKSRHR